MSGLSSTWKLIRGMCGKDQSSQSQTNPQQVALMNHSTVIQVPQGTGAGTGPSPNVKNFLNLDDDSATKTLPPLTVERILQIYETVLAGIIEDGKLFQKLYEISYTDDVPLMSYRNDRTLLQTACSFHDKSVAEEMVSQILHCNYVRRGNPEKVSQFINFQSEKDGWTTLHIAAKQYNRDAALLLIQAGADVTLECKKGFTPIQLIFSRIPEVITTIYDAHIEKRDPKAVVSSDDFKLRLDYTPVCGVHGPKDDKTLFLVETELLHESLRESSEKQRFRHLEHPLAYLFLRDKWERMGSLIGNLAFLHIFWCCLYISFTYQLYFSTCPNKGEQSVCKPLTKTTSLRGWFLLGGTIVFGVKAICNVILLPKDRRHYLFHFRHRPENSCVWLLLIFSLVGLGRWISLMDQESPSSQCHSFEYTFAAAGMVISFLLILWQMKKFPHSLIPVHIELFMKVLKNILVFVVAHIGLLIGFSLALQILMPEREEFNLFEGGFFKVFTMMTTGELNYDELFHSNETETTVPSPLSTKALLVTFQTLMNLAFLGITIGIAINDCQKLLDQSEMVNLSCRLEEMFLLERLLLSRIIQTRFRSKVEEYIVANYDGYAIKLFKNIPERLQSPIMTILDKASAK